jgi:hypothetical protein
VGYWAGSGPGPKHCAGPRCCRAGQEFAGPKRKELDRSAGLGRSGGSWAKVDVGPKRCVARETKSKEGAKSKSK